MSNEYIKNDNPVSWLTEVEQHLAMKNLFCEHGCSQANQCLQMAIQRSVEMLAFIFASKNCVYRWLAEDFSRALSALSTFKRVFLDPVIKTDPCAHYFIDIGIATNFPERLVNKLWAVLNCIEKAELKLSRAKRNFGTTAIDFFGRTIVTEKVISEKEKIPECYRTSNLSVRKNIATLHRLRQGLPKKTYPDWQ